MGGGRSPAGRRHVVLLGQLREDRQPERARPAAVEPYKPNGGGQVMELGKEIGLRAELHRDRYGFFDALYRKAQ